MTGFREKRDLVLAELTILIPTHKRPKVQHTFDQIPKSLHPCIVMTCPESDLTKLKKRCPGVRIEVCPSPECNNVERKRAWSVKNAVNTKKFIMFDDDITGFFCWVDREGRMVKTFDKGRTAYQRTTRKQLIRAFYDYCKALDEFTHGGFKHRFMSHGLKTDDRGFVYSTRLAVAWGGRTKVFKKYLEFGRTKLFEDAEWNLQLLGRGFQNFGMAYIQFNHKFHEENLGGVHKTRLAEHDKETRKLQDRWFPYVRVKALKSKTGKMQVFETDLMIHWSKMFKAAPLRNNPPKVAELPAR